MSQSTAVPISSKFDSFQSNIGSCVRPSSVVQFTDVQFTDEGQVLTCHITEKKKHIPSVVGKVMNLARDKGLQIQSRTDVDPKQVRLRLTA